MIRQLFAEAVHFGEGVLVVGAVGGGDAGVETGEGGLGVAGGGEGLGGHLVGGDVVGVVVEDAGELGETFRGAVLGDELHGQAVAGEGVGWVGLEDLGEDCDFVHDFEMPFIGRRGLINCMDTVEDSVESEVLHYAGEMSESVVRKVSESQSERSEIVFPADANPIGNLFGGRLMQYIDLVGAMAASRHARAFTVTASMDHLDFVAAVKVGELLILKASVNRAFRTSMEIGVKAMVEDVTKQRLRHVSSAYITFVAVDREGKGLVVPQLELETEHQRRRWEDAGRRRELRAEETMRKKTMRELLTAEWHV